MCRKPVGDGAKRVRSMEERGDGVRGTEDGGRRIWLKITTLFDLRLDDKI